MTPVEIAEQMQAVKQTEWVCRWLYADFAQLLETACEGEGEFREVCREVLDTSWRNVRRAAHKAREVPPEERDPLWSYASHPLFRPSHPMSHPRQGGEK